MKLALFTVAASAIALMAGEAHAQTTPAQVIEANQFLLTAIEQARSGGQLPVLAVAGTAGAVRTAYDVSALDGGEALTIEQLMPLCAAPIRSLMGYMLVGLSPTDLQGNPTQAVVLQMNQNTIRYQDEASLAMRFSLRCNALLLSHFSEVVAGWSEDDKTPARRAGAAQSRGGAVQTYTGVLMMAAEPTTRASNREIVLDEAVARADVYAGLMSPDQRREVIAGLDAILPAITDPGVRAQFGQVRTAMTRTDCSALCAL